MRAFLPTALILALTAAPAARAEAFLPFDFGSVPSFAWADPDPIARSPRWEGSYARMSTGFQVTSSKRLGTTAGPTVGFEGGTMLREGNVVYGVVGSFDYMQPIGGYATPRFNTIAYTRDFAGAIQFKAGVLATENLLVYAKVGGIAANETLRFGPTSVTMPFNRTDIAVRPDARVGAEWAITDRLTVGVEVGMTGQALR